MPVKTEDRPIEAVREEVIDILVYNYGQGKLSKEAFERRLDQASELSDTLAIEALAKDLEPISDAHYADYKKRDLGVKYTSKPAKESDMLVSIFGGSARTGRWSVPKEITSISIFGGSTLDFTDAEFYDKDITINAYCVFGGDDILIPENVNLVTKAFCIFGGIDNSAPNIADRNAPTITIDGIIIFGGLSVKIKRTMKEKLMAFAESLKNMLK